MKIRKLLQASKHNRRINGRFYHSVDFDKDGVCAIYTEMFIMIIYDDDNFETHVILIY